MLRFEVACGLKTLTSKKVRSYRLPQRPLAAMSRRAPSWVFADTPDSCSLVMGCRCGSTLTSLHTSDIRLAVRSRISLCLIDGNPPLGQEIASYPGLIIEIRAWYPLFARARPQHL